MSRLAILEDLKRRSVRLPEGLREEAIRVLAEVLGGREEIELAMVFGGVLVEGKPVRDIDVAVYTGYRVPPEDWPVYVDELRNILEKALWRRVGLLKAVDVVLLEYAPPVLAAKILRTGRILVERRPGLHALLLLHAADQERVVKRWRRMVASQAVASDMRRAKAGRRI